MAVFVTHLRRAEGHIEVPALQVLLPDALDVFPVLLLGVGGAAEQRAEGVALAGLLHRPAEHPGVERFDPGEPDAADPHLLLVPDLEDDADSGVGLVDLALHRAFGPALVHQHLGDHFARPDHLVRVVGRVERHPGVFFLEFLEDLVVVEFLGAEELHGGDPGPLVDDERDDLAAARPVAQFEAQVVGETGVPQRPELGAERLPVHRVAGFHREVREPGVRRDQVVAFDDHGLHGLGGLDRRRRRLRLGEAGGSESERSGEREAGKRVEPHYASAASNSGNSGTRTTSSPPASSPARSPTPSSPSAPPPAPIRGVAR